MEPQTVVPVSPTDGDIYLDATLGYRFYLAGDWIDLASLGGNGQYDAIVGSPAQVSAGEADYSTIQDAVNASGVIQGFSIFVLNGTYTENVTVTGKVISITGQGSGSFLDGDLTLSNSSLCTFKDLRVSGDLSLTSSNRNLFDNMFFDSIALATFLSDDGTGNEYTPGLERTQATGAFGASSINVNWNQATTFESTLDASMTYPLPITFSNVRSGRAITYVVKNATGVNRTLTFPILCKDGSFTGTVQANNANVYTFIRVGSSIIYAACIASVGLTPS